MNGVLTDLSTPALIHAIKANLYAFFYNLGRAPMAEFHTDQDLVRWCILRIPHPWFSGVLCLQTALTPHEQTIAQTLDYFRTRGVAAFTWWLEPELQRDSWDSDLARHGFHYDANTPGMAADLAALNEMTAAPPGLLIAPVEDSTTLKAWARAFTAGYELPGSWENGVYDLAVGLGLDLPIRNYLAFLNGKPVGTSVLFLGAGVAGVYNVATVPEARGLGIGAAVTLAALHDARDLGYRAGVLQSSDMGVRVYQRLGFNQLCAMEHYFCTVS